MPNQLSPRALERKYSPDVCYKEAVELLSTQSKEDIEAWRSHPCTKTILLQLEGDLSGLFLLWTNGAYTDENSIDGTSQKNVKALGMAQAIDDVINAINHIGEDDEEDAIEGLAYDSP